MNGTASIGDEPKPRDRPEVISDTIKRLRGRNGVGIQWFTDLRQTITVKSPVDGSGRVRVDIQAQT